MKNPNRKWKCPKEVLEPRLSLFWITVYRVRALCMAEWGYDPEMENFDQSPYHHNETGSKGGKTLAVRGAIVPLIEGHDATRKRWTANLTTFSNKDRLRDERPYAEFMFRHDDKTGAFLLRMREHIRSRGYGKWVTVAVSSSGSYKEADIVDFLDRHLPSFDQKLRRWRIMFADDFGPHKTYNVRVLCWDRGYVVILHPGGATPVTQTPDTDLNQHVRRIYCALEAKQLIACTKSGQSVAQLQPEEMVDIMVDVLDRPELHLQAADGYTKTAVAVDIDGFEDHKIVREAGDYWHKLGMREIVNKEVAMIN